MTRVLESQQQQQNGSLAAANDPIAPPLSEAERFAIVDAVIEELASALVEDILDGRQSEAEPEPRRPTNA